MDANFLLQFGALGFVVTWFMLRMEGRVDRLTQAIDRLTRASLINTATAPTATESVREHAKAIISEVDASETVAKSKKGTFA